MIATLSLWATSEISRAAVRHLQRSSSLRDNLFLFLVVTAIFLIWIGLYYWDLNRSRAPKTAKPPKSLFLEICEAHGLGSDERVLLTQAVQSGNLPHSAVVFVDRRILHNLADAGLPESGQYRSLLAKLFGTPSEDS